MEEVPWVSLTKAIYGLIGVADDDDAQGVTSEPPQYLEVEGVAILGFVHHHLVKAGSQRATQMERPIPILKPSPCFNPHVGNAEVSISTQAGVVLLPARRLADLQRRFV
jgi:hypothetical protein